MVSSSWMKMSEAVPYIRTHFGVYMDSEEDVRTTRRWTLRVEAPSPASRCA